MWWGFYGGVVWWEFYGGVVWWGFLWWCGGVQHGVVWRGVM